MSPSRPARPRRSPTERSPAQRGLAAGGRAQSDRARSRPRALPRSSARRCADL